MSWIRPLVRCLESGLAHTGHVLYWQPRALTNNAAAGLHASFELVCAHLLMTKPNPVFLEIGANDGVTTDPLFPFIKSYGWRGVMVEPVPRTFERLAENYAVYPQVQLVNAAIGAQDGEQTIYAAKEFPGQFERASLYSSFRKEVILKQVDWVPNIAKEIEEFRVPCYTLSTLLEKTRIGSVDILQIDTEGYDAQIIKMVDFERLNPAVIQFEHANLSKAEIEDCAQLLIGRGYKIGRDALDYIAYRPLASFGWR
jgi:FkbM family methyltransferase